MYSTKKEYLLVHPSRCLDSIPVVSPLLGSHVSSGNCTILLLDTDVEFHDNNEVDTVDETLVVDLLQLGCVWGMSAPNSSKMNESLYMLISLADASGSCTSVTCPSILRFLPNSSTV